MNQLRKRFLCNRLGRDNVLQNLKKETPSATYSSRYLSKSELINHLISKIIEEVHEVFADKDSEQNLKMELADVLEAISCLIFALGLTEEEILLSKHLKIEKRGSFKKGLFIYWVEIDNSPGKRIYDYVINNCEKYPAEKPAENSDIRTRFWYSKTGKLVRDGSIEALQQEDPSAKFKFLMLSKSEHLDQLFSKLIEEALEIEEEKNDINELKNEIADLLEVIDCICELKEISKIELELVANKKRLEFGSFKNGLFVEWFEVPKDSRMYDYALKQPDKYRQISIE